jgi:hypothetical protein
MEEQQQDPKEPTELALVIEELVETQRPTTAPERTVRTTFINPDIHYLVHRTGLEPKVVARMLRAFGEAVVVEALRRFANGWEYAPRSKEGLFVSLCRAVDGAGKST